MVNLADYTIWRNNLGATLPATIVAAEQPVQSALPVSASDSAPIIDSDASSLETMDAAFATFQSPEIRSKPSASSAVGGFLFTSTLIDDTLLLPLLDNNRPTSDLEEELYFEDKEESELPPEELLTLALGEWE